MSIIPIETLYRGYRFRSRLEARWAVFLDSLNAKYVYEHEGFVLPSGNYLPDFYFPKVRGILEVKPQTMLPVQHFEFDQPHSFPIRDDLPREIGLVSELASRLGGCGCVVYGDPLDVMPAFRGEGDGNVVSFTKRRGVRTGFGFEFLLYFSAHLVNCAIQDAADAARAARFEHGGSPR